MGKCDGKRLCPGVASLLLRPEVRWRAVWESRAACSRAAGVCPQPRREAASSVPGRFVTPDQKYSRDSTPHTPTPFKNALEKYGPLKPLVRGMAGLVLQPFTVHRALSL